MAKTNNKEYFAKKAAYTAINRNLRKAHPEWTNARIFAATKSLANKAQAPAVAEEVAQ